VVFFGQGLEINSSSSSFFGLVSSGLGYLVMEETGSDLNRKTIKNKPRFGSPSQIRQLNQSPL